MKIEIQRNGDTAKVLLTNRHGETFDIADFIPLDYSIIHTIEADWLPTINVTLSASTITVTDRG